MSLTAGRGPFGRQRAGRWDFDAPDHVVYVEAFPRRVRAVVAGEVEIDSDDVLLVHGTGTLPRDASPTADVHVHADDRTQIEIDGQPVSGD